MNSIIYRDPNVTVFQSALFQTNSTVLRTDDMVMVVDPAWLPDEIKTIRRHVEDIRGDRPLFMVFTHSDYDHILGYKAFEPEKVFTSKEMAEFTHKEETLQQIRNFDEEYYVNREYPLEFPEATFSVYKDGAQVRAGQTRMAFYLMPGHTADSMMVVVWQLGICMVGDYLSNVEFPIIGSSSVDYERSLEKLPRIHDRNWFTRLVPGHGSPALSINDWLARRTESLAYIYSIRESIATGRSFDETVLWKKYAYPAVQRKFHKDNVELMRLEYERGDWIWDPEHAIRVQNMRVREDVDEE